MQVYGILAYPAEHSLSPIIHAAAFEALKLEAEYQRFSVEPEELSDFMERVRTEEIAGFSVSMPHKEAVMKYLDEIDEAAEEIGAVNTAVNQEGRLKGYNFDGEGAVQALKERSDLSSSDGLRGKKVVVLGAGGAARAIVYALKQAGVDVTVLNRTREKAERLAADFEVTVGILADLADLEPDILVNATAVGMEPESEASLVPVDFLERLGEKLIVFDIVYKPLRTLLIQEAKKSGCQIITGEKMLLYQGVKQFEIWTGKKAPLEIMQESLKEAL